MAQGFKTPQVVREQDVKMVGPGQSYGQSYSSVRARRGARDGVNV